MYRSHLMSDHFVSNQRKISNRWSDVFRCLRGGRVLATPAIWIFFFLKTWFLAEALVLCQIIWKGGHIDASTISPHPPVSPLTPPSLRAASGCVMASRRCCLHTLFAERLIDSLWGCYRAVLELFVVAVV